LFDFNRPGAIIIFAATIILSLVGLYANSKVIELNLFRPYWFLRGKQYHTLFTSGLVHADLGHLLLNMVTFYFFAFDLEARIGTASFVTLYLFGLALSHGCTYFKHRQSPHYASLGASGAIAAVLFAFIVYFPTATLMILPLPIPIPAPVFAIAYVAYSYWAGKRQQGNINHDAHLCGALAGLLFVAVSDAGAFAGLGNLLG
jgi:membrane associated rhomboid family serine protease